MSSQEASSSDNPKPNFLPPLRIHNGKDMITTGSSPNNEKPVPKKSDRPDRPIRIRHRFLAPPEWTIVAHGIGGVRDHEAHMPVHPTSSLWPPKGLPPGLYREVVYHRTKFWYYFHFLSIVRWVGLVLQLIIGATLTALGSMSTQHGDAITILAAANTVQSGILALMHNSGLPERYRSNRDEFQEVEDHLRELLDAGLCPANMTLDQVLADCYARFQEAKKTVQANVPTTYTPSSQLQPGSKQGATPQSGQATPATGHHQTRDESPKTQSAKAS